jgi:hypothetical protein
MFSLPLKKEEKELKALTCPKYYVNKIFFVLAKLTALFFTSSLSNPIVQKFS